MENTNNFLDKDKNPRRTETRTSGLKAKILMKRSKTKPMKNVSRTSGLETKIFTKRSKSKPTKGRFENGTKTHKSLCNEVLL